MQLYGRHRDSLSAGGKLAVGDADGRGQTHRRGRRQRRNRLRCEHRKRQSTPVQRFHSGVSQGPNDSIANRTRPAPRGGTLYRGGIYEYARGSLEQKNLGIDVRGHVAGIASDKNGDLLLVDNKCNCIDVFPPGATAPTLQINGAWGNELFGVTIDRSNTEIWVTDAFGGNIFGLSYPAGQPEDRIAPRLGWTFGVAASPNGLSRR